MQTMDTITRRQGVLRYLPEPVEPEKIQQVIQAAISAASPANSQPWTFIVVTNPDLTHKIAHYLIDTQADYVFGQLLEIDLDFNQHLMALFENLDQAPCFIVVCREVRVDLGGGGFNSVLRDWDLLCLGAATGNLMTSATALGLGTRWFGGLLMDEGGKGLKHLLDIPDKIEIVAVTPLGYHQEAQKDRPIQSREVFTDFKRGDKYKLAALLDGKLPLEEVVHFDRYTERES